MVIEGSGRWVWRIIRRQMNVPYSLVPKGKTCVLGKNFTLEDAHECVRAIYAISADYNPDILAYFEREIDEVAEIVFRYSTAQGFYDKHNGNGIEKFLEWEKENGDKTRV